jgi:hypothetical protein
MPKTKVTNFRLTPALAKMLEAERVACEKDSGLEVTEAALVRKVLEEGLTMRKERREASKPRRVRR